MTKDQKEVARRRMAHKEVTKKGGPQRPEGAGKKKEHWAAKKNPDGGKCEI